MGCFCGCFGHLRRNLSTKKIQHQCLSPTPSNEQHECVKLLPEISESQKQDDDEQIINPSPIKVFFSESQDKHQEKTVTDNEKNPFFHRSNLEKEANEFASSNSDQEMQCGAVIEESCSSLFSLSIDSRRQVYGADMGEKEVSSLMKKTEKKRSLENDEEKENNVDLSKDPIIIIMEQSIEKSKPIETSLSTWLVESKTSGGSSPESENNYADRQISTVGSTWRCSGGHQPESGLTALANE